MRIYICEKCRLLKTPISASKCGECKKIKARDWYAKNKDKYASWRKKYRAENPKKVREIKKLYYLANRKKVRAQKNEQRKKYEIKYRSKHLQSRKRKYSRREYGEYWEAHRIFLDLKTALLGEK